MRQLLILFTVFCLWAGPVLAQAGDSAAYEVTDVVVDLTADSAAHAHDQAISEAQRAAFVQLLDRLDTDTALAAKLKPDDLATLVQNFEVQNERASSVRYIGTFTVQFRPNAVRSFLAAHGASAADARSKPVVVLPIYLSNGHPILWEESTRWRAAWDKDSHDDGLVPVIMPTGALEDINVLSTDEAVGGKADPLKALIAKYQAGGAVVATLNGSIDNPAAGFTVDMIRYDADGNASPVEHLTLPPVADKAGLDDALIQGVRQVRHQLEKDWKQDAKAQLGQITPTVIDPAAQGQDPSVQAAMADSPATHLPVTVSISTLGEWAQIRRKLTSTPGISRVDVEAVQRGSANIELEFHGTVQELQTALQQQQLRLSQDLLSNSWVLRAN